jgi:hypothetical protein
MSAQNRLPIFLLVAALFSLAYAAEEQDETVPREFGGLAGCRLLPSTEVFERSLKVRAEWSVHAGSERSVTKTKEEIAT